MIQKNQKLLESFSAYCKQNPEQRFWQALRNWCGSPFVGVSNISDDDYVDTFYSNKQDGK